MADAEYSVYSKKRKHTSHAELLWDSFHQYSVTIDKAKELLTNQPVFDAAFTKSFGTGGYHDHSLLFVLIKNLADQWHSCTVDANAFRKDLLPLIQGLMRQGATIHCPRNCLHFCNSAIEPILLRNMYGSNAKLDSGIIRIFIQELGFSPMYITSHAFNVIEHCLAVRTPTYIMDEFIPFVMTTYNPYTSDDRFQAEAQQLSLESTTQLNKMKTVYREHLLQLMLTHTPLIRVLVTFIFEYLVDCPRFCGHPEHASTRII